MSSVMIARVLIVLFFLVAGGTTGFYLRRVLAAPAPLVRPVDPQVDHSIADPSLSPSEVVRIQIESLRKVGEDPRHMVTCYSLASPANRASTGPLAHFSAMCFSQPYEVMSSAEDWQIGAVQSEGDYASVVVSFSQGREVRAFGFFLRRQVAQPFRDCWMTDSVIAFPNESLFPTARRSLPERSDVD